jgi:hypothetical protein
VDSDVWAKIALHLQGICSEELRLKRFRHQSPLIDSLPSIPHIFSLSSILGQFFSLSSILPLCPLQQFEKKKAQLLYRGSRDGFRASNFHEKCDGHANTVTLITSTKGAIFGGFTSATWDSSNSWQTDKSPASFLFRVGLPKPFPMSSTSNAIYCTSSAGPRFGGGVDLRVRDNCNENTSSYANLGSSYQNSTDLPSREALAGEYNFQVKEIEVFSIVIES